MVRIKLDDKSILERGKKIPITCQAGTPKIYMTELVRLKMHAMARIVYQKIAKKEVFGFLAGPRPGFATHLLIPQQLIEGGYVHLEPECVAVIKPELKLLNEKRAERNIEIRKYNDSLKEKNEEIKNQNDEREKGGDELLPLLQPRQEYQPLMIVGWTHSHVDFSVFSSGTDDREHEIIYEELRNSNLSKFMYEQNGGKPGMFYVFGITVNIFKEECLVINRGMPCGYRPPTIEFKNEGINEVFTELPWEEIITDEQLVEEFRELKEDILKKVTVRDYKYDRSHYKKGSKQDAIIIKPRPRSTVAKSLDNYFAPATTELRTSFDTQLDLGILDKIKDAVGFNRGFSLFKEDGIIINEILKIKKLLKDGGNQAMFQSIREIMDRTREICVNKFEEVISDEINESETKGYIFPEEDEDDDDEEEDDSDFWEDGEREVPLKCHGCGENFGNDDEEGIDFKVTDGGVDGARFPVCKQCWSDYEFNETEFKEVECTECNEVISDPDGQNWYTLDKEFICDNCADNRPDKDVMRKDADGIWILGDGTIIESCAWCDEPFTVDDNDNQEDDDGNRLCNKCYDDFLKDKENGETSNGEETPEDQLKIVFRSGWSLVIYCGLKRRTPDLNGKARIEGNAKGDIILNVPDSECKNYLYSDKDNNYYVWWGDRYGKKTFETKEETNSWYNKIMEIYEKGEDILPYFTGEKTIENGESMEINISKRLRMKGGSQKKDTGDLEKEGEGNSGEHDDLVMKETVQSLSAEIEEEAIASAVETEANSKDTSAEKTSKKQSNPHKDAVEYIS